MQTQHWIQHMSIQHKKPLRLDKLDFDFAEELSYIDGKRAEEIV